MGISPGIPNNFSRPHSTKMGNKAQKAESLVMYMQTNDQGKIIKYIEDIIAKDKSFINSPLNRLGDTILHYAAYKQQLEVVKACLLMGADGSIKNDRGFRPIDLLNDAEKNENVERIIVIIKEASPEVNAE